MGQLTTEYQATSGSVNTSTTPKVQYTYSEMSGGANHSRLTSMTYPNGRVLNYNYSSGLDSNISRLSSINDGANTLESYQYLGYGSVVSRDHAQPGVNLSYIKLSTESTGDGGDQYTGLDRFSRVIDQRWRTAGGTDKDRFGYAYDRDSNRLYKENLVSSTNSEIYSYDNLNQLTGYERGTLNGTKTGLTGSASRSQSWDFDGLGNFDSQTTDGVSQTRSHNQQNEITSISGTTTPTYDANGNLTTDETGRTFKYDAWNRLVETNNSGGTTLATYKWDGAGRRVQETRGSNTTDLYYSSQWQVIEERVGGAAKFSYAWSPVYVDAMITRDRDTDNNGSLDERLYALQDANFNMTALMDVSGNVDERFHYDPFGKFSVLDAGWSAIGTSAFGWNYLHQGGRWDDNAGVYSFRHRELNPTLGRWTTNDPIGFDGGNNNLSVFCRNLPASKFDPLELRESEYNNLFKGFFWEFLTFHGVTLLSTRVNNLTTPLFNEEFDYLLELLHPGSGISQTSRLAIQKKLDEHLAIVRTPEVLNTSCTGLSSLVIGSISKLGDNKYSVSKIAEKTIIKSIDDMFKTGCKFAACQLISKLSDLNEKSPDSEINLNISETLKRLGKERYDQQCKIAASKLITDGLCIPDLKHFDFLGPYLPSPKHSNIQPGVNLPVRPIIRPVPIKPTGQL